MEQLKSQLRLAVVKGLIQRSANYANIRISGKAIDEVFRISTGIPRVVNRVCKKSLMYAFQRKKHLIDDYSVRYVADHELAEGASEDDTSNRN